MKTYNRALNKLKTDPYTKGEYKGHAPVGSRTARHRRYIQDNEYILAHMHSTDVFVLHPDGLIEFDSGDWHNNPTTRDFIDEVMPRKFCSIRYSNKSHYAVRTTQGLAKVRTRMVFREDEAGNLKLDTAPEKFTKTVCDRAPTKALREKLKPIYDMAEMMLLCGDPGPFGYRDLKWLFINDADECLEYCEDFARALMHEVYQKRRKFTATGWVNRAPELKDLRDVFNTATQLRTTKECPEFL